jgi:arylsulfatase A-like enzyme
MLGCGSAEPEPASSSTEPVRLFADETQATIVTETRVAVVLQPERAERARFEVTLPAEPALRFGFGVPNASIAKGHGPLRFDVHIEAGGARKTLATRKVDPQDIQQRRWFDARLDLAEWAERDVTLELAVAVPPGGDARTLGAFAHPTIESGAHRDARPNLLIVSIDTLRAQNVSSYGYPRKTTPFLDELAEQGTLFEDAITTSTTTAPSHMSLFTGLYPVHHGIRAGYNDKLPGPVIASTLAAAGYRTAAFTENGFLVRERGFGEGFEAYTENHGSRIQGPGEAHKTFGQAARWIQAATGPFFLFVHTYQTHAPFWPPPGYETLFADEPVPGVDDPLMRKSRDDYDREIRYTDDELAKLVGALDTAGLRDSTLIVVLSDHGEEFLEHGAYQHGAAVFEETLRIPLVLAGPGVPKGQRIPDSVSLIDVFPTALALLGVEPPSEIDGTNLVPRMRDEAELEARTLFAEAAATRRWTAPFEGTTWNPPLIAARTAGEKFILHRPWEGEATAPAHYDLASDALEQSPLPFDAATQARADALVDAYLEGAPRPNIPKPSELDPDERRRLELLGYIEGTKP